MESLLIPPTEGEFITPYVHFDLSTSIFEISGESFLEDTDSFYAPIVAWLRTFKDASTQAIVFNFKFHYYNSSSSKAILRILKILKEYTQKAQVVINWHYPAENKDLLQEGIDFQDMVEMPINLIKV